MPTSPQQKTAAVFCDFQQIRNIRGRADVGIGPYDYVFRHAEAARNVSSWLLFHAASRRRRFTTFAMRARNSPLVGLPLSGLMVLPK